MIQRKTILESHPFCLKTVDIPNLGKKHQGKVRDVYILKDKRVVVTTDRQSAFDRILGYIPFKGAVLNSLAYFWFKKTKKIIDNHVIDMPNPNVLIAKNCKPLPVEMVVRGYMTGVTNTSIWHSYQKGERSIYGIKFPDGMKKNQKLLQPVITPTTHPEMGSDKHDERLTKKEIIENKIVDKNIYEKMEEVSLELFRLGSQWCKKKGIILVDTKYEFGMIGEKLVLMDEIHTPDSSRFWIAKTYEGRFKKGLEPENFDKEFLRLWYKDKGYTGDGKPPKMSDDLIVETSKRYIGAYEILSGEKFKSFKYPIGGKIGGSVNKYFEKK